MNDDITDTGPLKWSRDHTRGQWIASLAIVVCSLTILGMVLAYAWWWRV